MKYRIGGLIFVLLGMATFAQAQIQVMLPDTTANWNSQITIPVRVSNVSAYDVYSYEFIMKYDSLILTPIGVDQNGTITSSWQTPVYNDTTKGTLVIGGYGVNVLAGSGNLVNILFRVIGKPDDISNLTFTYFQFNSGNPTASTVNGRVKIINNLVEVTITTNILNGTQVRVDGISYTAPFTANWEIGSTHELSTLSPQTFDGKRYIFESWSDQGAQNHSVSATQPTTFTAKFAAQYYLSIQSDYGNPQGSGWYNAGTTAYFSVDSSLVEGSTTKHNFVSWAGSGSGSYSGALRKTSVLMNAPITELANWSTLYYVDIISSQGYPYGTGWYLSGSAVSFGVDSTTITHSDAYYQFRSWTGSGSGSYTGTNPRVTITVAGPITEQAKWEENFLVVTGSLPDGILNVPGAGWYQGGQQFTTIKAPDPLIVNSTSYIFKGWKINNNPVLGNPITISIDAPKTVIADYSSEITVVITTSVGQNTKVIVDGQEKNAPYTSQWLAGSRHSIGVVNIQNGISGTRYLYRKWSHGGDQTQNVTPATNTTYVAELETQYYLEVKDEPVGVINPKGSDWYSAMQVVKLDSLPQSKLSGQSSYRFIKWQVDGVDSFEQSISIRMDKPHQTVAFYQNGFFIAGTFTFVGSTPVPISMNVSGKENFSVQSNADGSYLIAGLLSGDYVVTVTHPGYSIDPGSRSYHITKNEENQYYFAFYLSSIAPDKNLDPIPDRYELSQNYPNPFADQTIIEYMIKKNDPVKLTVYNVLGQVIHELINFQQPAGLYKIQWNRMDRQGDRVPPGIYFYRIEAGSFIQIKKMILL